MNLDADTIFAISEAVRYAQAEGMPTHWKERSLYFSTGGSDAWLEVISEQRYKPSHERSRIRELRQIAVDGYNFSTFVSLGPGDGLEDTFLTNRCPNADHPIDYIPVDISRNLLNQAVCHGRKNFRVPVAIHCDFENDLGFIWKNVEHHGRVGRLYSMLGNTFGCLDLGEEQFVAKLSKILDPADRILIDMSLLGPKWEAELDIRLNSNAYSPTYKRLLANGLALRTGASMDAMLESFDKYFAIEAGFSNQHFKEIEGTLSIHTIERKTRRVLGTMRRYSWSALTNWITSKMGLEIVCAHATYRDNNSIGNGVVLLRGATKSGHPCPKSVRSI